MNEIINEIHFCIKYNINIKEYKGLKMKDKMDTIDKQLRENPYKIYKLPIGVCDKISIDYGLILEEERKEGVIIRELYNNVEERKWVGTPEEIIKDKCKKEKIRMGKI